MKSRCQKVIISISIPCNCPCINLISPTDQKAPSFSACPRHLLNSMIFLPWGWWSLNCKESVATHRWERGHYLHFCGQKQSSRKVNKFMCSSCFASTKLGARCPLLPGSLRQQGPRVSRGQVTNSPSSQVGCNVAKLGFEHRPETSKHALTSHLN